MTESEEADADYSGTESETEQDDMARSKPQPRKSTEVSAEKRRKLKESTQRSKRSVLDRHGTKA